MGAYSRGGCLFEGGAYSIISPARVGGTYLRGALVQGITVIEVKFTNGNK